MFIADMIVFSYGPSDLDTRFPSRRSCATPSRRNPMPKLFAAIVPPSLKAVSETFQFAPAVRIGGQILISGIVGTDAQGLLPPDFRSQAENVFARLEATLNEVGATLDDVASLTSYPGGHIGRQLPELGESKAIWSRPPYPAATGGGGTQLEAARA